MADYIIQKPIDRKDMTGKALKEELKHEYVMQPKYDGCCMVVVLRHSPTATSPFECYSSTGEEVRSCDHIGRALLALISPEAEDIAVIGEVWKPDTEFPEISGMFRRHNPEPTLMFAPFDACPVQPGQLRMESARTYHDRTRCLREMHGNDSIVPFESFPVNEHSPLPTEYAATLKAKGGYDGAVLHAVDAPYFPARAKWEAIKVKPLVELDLLVVGVEKAIGEKTGRPTVALQVRLKDGKVGKVATGLNHDQQANPEQFVGKIVAVAAMALTKDGMLREPRFKGERFDKIAPDF